MQILEVPIESITYDDTKRHRKTLSDIDSLAESIKRIGLLNPIILSGHTLVAGRRRLEAFRQLGFPVIPARQITDLSTKELKLVELDENIRRSDITWQEQAEAIHEIHQLLGGESVAATADFIGLGERIVYRYLGVFDHITDERVAACTSLSAASNIIERRQQIAIESELSRMDAVEAKPLRQPVITANAGVVFVEQQAPSEAVVVENFLDWAPKYSGPKFNFIHCDFPYGIGFNKSAQAATSEDDTQYEDSPEIFFALLDCLMDNLDRISYNSAHIFFWFSMKYYADVLERFSANGLWYCPTPFIWHKTDQRGIASDVKRRPKHIYETALIASIGDRHQLKLCNDTYGCPIAKSSEGHVSAKPQPMLEYFLSAYVSSDTEFLDPTCGSGTALRAAAKLGASRVLGLEIDPQTAEGARLKFFQQERLRKATKGNSHDPS
jgi:ParB/RepB/Spo0J family partition protein